MALNARRTLVLLCFLAAGAVTARPASAQIPVGEFELDESLSDDVNTAINAATSTMNFIARPIARKRLRSSNPVTRVVTIQEIGDSIEVTSDRQIVLRAKADGVPMPWSAFRGEKLEVITIVHDGVLVNTFSAGDGSRTNRYVLRDDDMLEMQVTISSPRLERPLEYKRVYRRIETASR
jgi:hypothetical protein